ncbi:alkaline phosphatase D family protein [Dongia deserti]|uniref:alkaline phosphatase D family protein n=1 Tax=Dongia deserti TaxID=2268030 RepID=UPI002548C785|nr:alkaline phosphatase D family protein [Dongia deserti]
MPRTSSSRPKSRRTFLKVASAGALMIPAGLAMPRLSRAVSRPVVTHGLQAGDVGVDHGVIWARADRPARAIIEVATTEGFRDARTLPYVDVLPETDYVAKLLVENLPAGHDIFYRVTFFDLADANAISEPVSGRFRTAPTGLRDVSFTWSGDTAGQGWGIDLDRGGMKAYATMLKHQPDFFIHCGDTVYADGPLAAEVDLPDGSKWKNVMIEEKAKVAETLAEFRAQYKYNLMDQNLLAFNAQVPMLAQWDDHEVTNNWSDSKVFDDRYTEKNVRLLAARAARAFHEFMPIAPVAAEQGRVYRKVSYGPLLDVFFVDMRRYRGPNGGNLEAEPGVNTVFLGRDQIEWLKRELLASKATWKVISADMPLSLLIWNDAENKKGFEGIANNEPGAPRGREMEFAELLSFMKAAKIRNTVWLTADVHYTAAHYYDPNKAAFQDFNPFWEFVSGPIHAGTFGPNELDMTFGPDVKYAKSADGTVDGLSPAAGLQFFGHVKIAGDTGVMTVTLRDVADAALWSVDLTPEQA